MVKLNNPSLDGTFSALSDRSRRRMLHQLEQGELTVGELARPHRMSLPAVSKHLRVLEEAGLVRRRKDGRTHFIRLRAEPLRKAMGYLEDYRRFWESSLDRLDGYLQETKTKGRKR